MEKFEYKKINKIKDYLIQECLSKDFTRYILRGVHHDPETKVAISTDGHRLFLSKSFYCEKLKGLTVASNIEVVVGDFPNYKKILLGTNCLSIEINISENLNTKNQKVPDRCYLNLKDGVYTIDHEEKQDSLASFNSYFFKKLEGGIFKALFKCKASPIEIEIDQVSFYTIMPMRMGSEE